MKGLDFALLNKVRTDRRRDRLKEEEKIERVRAEAARSRWTTQGYV